MAAANLKKADVKIVIMGESGVGKSSFIGRYLRGTFAVQPHTMGAAFSIQKWGSYNVAIWDTAGEERYGRLTSFYCRGASGVIVAYDITSKKTFTTLKERFVPLLEDANSHRLVAVVGTKTDLLDTLGREVSEDDGKSLAIHLNENWRGKKLQQVPFFESSSKDGINVKEVFEFLLSNLLPLDETTTSNSQISNTLKSNTSNTVDTIKLSNDRPSGSQSQNKRGSCCG